MSNEARKFIESLFTRDPLKRATAKQCLAHDWIVKYAKNTASIKLEPVDFRQVEREKQKEGLNFLFNHSLTINYVTEQDRLKAEENRRMMQARHQQQHQQQQQ